MISQEPIHNSNIYGRTATSKVGRRGNTSETTYCPVSRKDCTGYVYGIQYTELCTGAGFSQSRINPIALLQTQGKVSIFFAFITGWANCLQSKRKREETVLAAYDRPETGQEVEQDRRHDYETNWFPLFHQRFPKKFLFYPFSSPQQLRNIFPTLCFSKKTSQGIQVQNSSKPRLLPRVAGRKKVLEMWLKGLCEFWAIWHCLTFLIDRLIMRAFCSL